MTTEQMYDLAFAHLNDGTIRLEQRDYCGESAIIDLHPCQLRHIAERAGLLPALPMPCNLAGDDDDTDEMHHLQVVRDDDGTVHLYQTQLFRMGGSDEHVILHRTQAAWLGARLLPCSWPSPAPAGASLEAPDGGCRARASECNCGPSERDLFDERAAK